MSKNVSIETKAAYLCGMFAATHDREPDQFRRELVKVIRTAAAIAFGGGALNPIAVYEMERFYDRIVDNCQKANADRIATGTPHPVEQLEASG